MTSNIYTAVTEAALRLSEEQTSDHVQHTMLLFTTTTEPQHVLPV